MFKNSDLCAQSLYTAIRRDGFVRQPRSGCPQLGWGSAELTVCSSGVNPVPTGNSHREFLLCNSYRELSAAGAGPGRLQSTRAKPAWSVPVLTVTALLALNPNSQSLTQVRIKHSEQPRRVVPRYVHFSLLRAGLLLVFLTCLTAKWSSQFQTGKKVAGCLKLQQQLLGESTAILTD